MLKIGAYDHGEAWPKAERSNTKLHEGRSRVAQGYQHSYRPSPRPGNVRYSPTDKLEVEICFHLTNPKLTILDVDNRLKDVLDTLQRFVGDKGKSGELRPIIPNVSQIYRVIAEKRLTPKVNRAALSTIVIRRYDHHGGTVREPRDTRKLANLKAIGR